MSRQVIYPAGETGERLKELHEAGRIKPVRRHPRADADAPDRFVTVHRSGARWRKGLVGVGHTRRDRERQIRAVMEAAREA